MVRLALGVKPRCESEGCGLLSKSCEAEEKRQVCSIGKHSHTNTHTHTHTHPHTHTHTHTHTHMRARAKLLVHCERPSQDVHHVHCHRVDGWRVARGSRRHAWCFPQGQFALGLGVGDWVMTQCQSLGPGQAQGRHVHTPPEMNTSTSTHKNANTCAPTVRTHAHTQTRTQPLKHTRTHTPRRICLSRMLKSPGPTWAMVTCPHTRDQALLIPHTHTHTQRKATHSLEQKSKAGTTAGAGQAAAAGEADAVIHPLKTTANQTSPESQGTAPFLAVGKFTLFMPNSGLPQV